MITRYPVLEKLSTLAGIYKSDDGVFELELRRNGYDYLLLTKGGPSRSQLYGVIGVAGKNLELHASMGLPNIITFSWPHALEETSTILEICFQEVDNNLSINFRFEGKKLTFSLALGGVNKSNYVLRKA
ncbi:hypothetical protein [Pseudomonas mangrovi]|uniref:hypothetical protein n=1 Tax=Pseudomonas mangrovi TaxID=2161748 RepID=UPI0011B2723A|nr:hypothetical protein [Pseudomonas mangrovi]